MRCTAVLALAPILAAAQQPGTQTKEVHPQLSTQACTKAGGCATEQTAVTVDANWRWIDSAGKNCYTGQAWDAALCPDPVTCAQNCAIEGAGAEYKSTYGVDAAGAAMTLDFVTQGPYSKNVGSRNYLMADESTYKLFNLKNREFTFDVDVSKLGCGLNGAIYFVAMDADGGMSKHAGNKAGAKYGTGYCDAQCPHDVKFINGEANMAAWTPNPKDKNSGTGKYGACCTEMDIWEANSISTAFTPHACTGTGHTRCEGVDCGDGGHRFDGLCDKNGCDMQTYRMGEKTFFGPGPEFAVDSSKPMTVVTQFITADGTDTGALTEIRRFYVQNGKAIPTPPVNVGGKAFDSVSDEYCAAEVGMFKDNTNFLQKGGMSAMDKAMEQGMVLVMSLWDDHDVNMLWLDSTYPTNGTCEAGACRGTCAATSGNPADIETSAPHSSYKVSNIKHGELGSTTSAHPGPSPPAPRPTPPAPGPGPVPPPPGGCPGGSLSGCMSLCPSSPAAAYKACINNCVARC